MKILIVAPYVYIKDWPEFAKNSTGFGIMVRDIFESISALTDTYLLTQVITEGHDNILRHKWKDVFISANLRDWARGLKMFSGYHQSVVSRFKYFYYGLNGGTLRKTIKSLNPDVVHIHGLGLQEKPFIDVCNEMGIPYVVTLHGLIGLDESINSPRWDKDLEETFLKEADEKQIPITVISSGMKRRIEKSYLGHEAKNITVVCNGTRIDGKYEVDKTVDLRKRYHIVPGEKIIIVIGSICDRKNQAQVLKAYRTGLISSPCHVFFCGKDTTDGEIEKEIISCDLQDRLHVLGFVHYDAIANILEQVDLNVVASKDEDFGLSIIEAYSHGVPTVTFADLDAVSDLYNENAMIKVENRSDEALAEGIDFALKKPWNKEKIKSWSEQFSLETMAQEYETQYARILARGGLMPTQRTVDYLMIKRMLGYKILTYVGNITDNKNQMALVQAMDELTQKKIVVLVGREADDEKVRRTIISKELQSCTVIAGYCKEMDAIWKSTDLNVFLSKNDGFGLAIIEGYVRGIPCVLNKDLDAFEDVYSPECCVKTGLKKEEITKAIDGALGRQWNIEQIKTFGQRFGILNMAKQYISLFGVNRWSEKWKN